MTEDLLYNVKEGAAFLTINRESRRNAISQEMIAAFLDYLDRADQDDHVCAVCITGAGEKAFCSGADLALTLAKEGEDPLSGARNYAKLLKQMALFGKPLLARVNGPCLAGGLGLMLSCDIVLARNDLFFSTRQDHFHRLFSAHIAIKECTHHHGKDPHIHFRGGEEQIVSG